MDKFLKIIKKIQEQENFFIEDRFYIYYTRLSYFIIKSHTFSIYMIRDDDGGMKCLNVRNEESKEMFQIEFNVKFEINFKNLIQKIKLESLYKSKSDTWFKDLENQLINMKIAYNRNNLKREIDKVLKLNTEQEREIRIMQILFSNSIDRTFLLCKEGLKVLEDGNEIGILDTEKIA
jgi:hypothetical protein